MFEGIHTQILSIAHLSFSQILVGYLFIACPLCYLALRKLNDDK